MSSPNLHPMINVAVKAARAAGAIINRAALDVESVRVSQKQVNDFVTEVDQAAEVAIIETLLAAYPGHGIWAEESGRTHGAQDSDYVWIIDPLDGTTNFIHGLPVYCVSIALAVKGKVEQAVIYDPTRNDLFTATRGRGAFLNDRRIRVSKRVRLQECLISTGFPFRQGDDFNTYLRMMGDVMQRTAGLRRPGAAALDLAYVAAGFTDGFLRPGCSPGMWRRVRCWSPRPVGWWAISRVRQTFWSKKSALRARRAFTVNWSACSASTASLPAQVTKPPCAKPLRSSSLWPRRSLPRSKNAVP